MTDERWHSLMKDDALSLTEQEIKDGWHFCVEWDGLLIGPCMGELECCSCFPSNHWVYTTCPIKDV